MCSASSDQNIRLWPREKEKKKEKSSHNSGALLLSDNMVHCSAYQGMETHLPGSSEIKKCWCCWGKKREIEVFWGIFRWLVSEASALCLTSIFCSEREKGAAMSVLPLPIIPALLCCWCLLAESEGGKNTFSCSVLTKFCVSRIHWEVSHHLCTMNVLNLHVGCGKRLFDQRFRLCAEAEFFFFKHSLAILASWAQHEGSKKNPCKSGIIALTAEKCYLDW